MDVRQQSNRKDTSSTTSVPRYTPILLEDVVCGDIFDLTRLVSL